jgi:hypothetical protein
MTIELSRLQALLKNKNGSLQVGILPSRVSSILRCPLGIVYLSCPSLQHIVDRHPSITFIDMLCMSDMISDGEWFVDKANGACVVYAHPETMKLYKAAIKVVRDPCEIYVTTFHRTDPRQIHSIRLKHKKIKN